MKNNEKSPSGQMPGDEPETIQGFWSKDRVLQVITLVFVIALLLVIIWQRKNIAGFSIWLAQYAGLKYLGIFILSMAASATLIIPIPGLAMTSAMGALSPDPWDPLWVGLASGVGATIGELTGYMLGYSGRMAMPYNKTYERVVGWMAKWGNWTIFLLALIPNPLFDIAGMASGVLKYPAWKFMLLGAAGRIPKHILFSYLGYWGVHAIPFKH
ncbi:MAG: VTT domain-containing protein [Chloroflexi bacterium]|nr:VTT domain-containing protein [Chloroflexota bacterium]